MLLKYMHGEDNILMFHKAHLEFLNILTARACYAAKKILSLCPVGLYSTLEITQDFAVLPDIMGCVSVRALASFENHLNSLYGATLLKGTYSML